MVTCGEEGVKRWEEGGGRRQREEGGQAGGGAGGNPYTVDLIELVYGVASRIWGPTVERSTTKSRAVSLWKVYPLAVV